MSAAAAGGPVAPDILVNADDFGLHPRVSLAIARCLDEGLIHSFSVLPFPEADAFHDRLLRDILARHPGVRVGAHLTVLAPGGGEGLREHPGHFREFLLRYVTGRFPRERVAALWDAQVRSLGRYLGGPDRLAHLDSHQHLHMLPGLWTAARELQERYRIPRLRLPYEPAWRAALRGFPAGLALQILARARLRPGHRLLIGFSTSTGFTLEGNLPLLREARRRTGRAWEVMVHPALPAGTPGLPDAPSSHGDCLRPSQEREIEELRRLKAFLAA